MFTFVRINVSNCFTIRNINTCKHIQKSIYRDIIVIIRPIIIDRLESMIDHSITGIFRNRRGEICADYDDWSMRHETVKLPIMHCNMEAHEVLFDAVLSAIEVHLNGRFDIKQLFREKP